MKKNLPILMTLVVVTGIAIIVWLKFPASHPQNSANVLTQTATNQLFLSNATVVIKDSPSNASLSDIYLQDSQTQKESLFTTLPDVYKSHYHNAEYHNGNLYIIRRTGGDTGYETNPNWTDELWKYNSAKQGVKLYSSRGLDFRVADDEKLISLLVDQNKVVLVDGKGTTVKQIDLSQFGVATIQNISVWSKDGFWVGGMGDSGPSLATIIKINATTFQPSIFDTSKLPINISDFALNPTTRKIVFSTYPPIFDTDTAAQFQTSKKTVTLFVYDLNIKTQQQISTSVAKQFHPRWINDTTIEYDNPSGAGKLTKTVF